MKSFGAVLALSGAASAAAILPRQSSDSHCCFDINVAGVVAGPLGQLADGQNRVGPGFTGTQFCYYNGTTSIVDSTGRGCIATAPTSQYQCDAGLTASTATPGITIANNGSIEHNGSAVWYECNSGSGYNIYANSPGSAATGCSQVMLNIANGNCSVPVAAPSSSQPAASPSVPASSGSSVPASSASVPASSPSAPASSPSAPVSSATTIQVTQTTAATTTVSPGPSTASTTLVSTVSQSPSTASVTIVSTAPASSCVPTTVTAPAPPAATVTAPAPPAVTVTAPAPPAVTVTAPAPPAVTVTAPAASCVPNTVTVTVTAPGMPSAPGSATTSAPAAPPATTYACNPAHSYPGGVSCISSGTGLTLVTPSATAPVSSAPGSMMTSAPVAPPATTYACNPAHSYPGGVSCVSSGTGLTLVTPSATAPVSSAPAPSAPAPSAPAPSAPASSVASVPAQPSPSAPVAGACAPGLGQNNYEYPHLIVPVSSAHPDTAYGTQYFAGINSTFSTIFNFDIPASSAGKTCTLEFLLPNAADLVTSSYTMSGTGGIDFKHLASPATQGTTFANQPAIAKDLGQFTVTSGSSTIVASGPCAAGTTVSYELTAEGNTELYYFQDWNPSAIGLYIVEC